MSEGGASGYTPILGAISGLFGRPNRERSQFQQTVRQVHYNIAALEQGRIPGGWPLPASIIEGVPNPNAGLIPAALAALRGWLANPVGSPRDYFVGPPPTPPAPPPQPAPIPQGPNLPPQTPQTTTQPPTPAAGWSDWVATLPGKLASAAELSALLGALISLFRRPNVTALPVGYGTGIGWIPQTLGGPNVPYQLGGGLLTDLGGLAGGVASVINAIRGPQAMPGGYPVMGASFVGPAGGAIARSLPWVLGGAGAGLGAMELFGGNGGSCPTAPFAQATAGPRAQIFVAANPVTGKPTWFRPAGRPILWSSDLSACRRVRKVAGRARRRAGGR